MKRIVTTALVSVLLLVCPAAWADFYPLTPPDPDLYDLEHQKYYTWGIDTPWPQTEEAVAATLSFTQIRNWREESNVLYIHLLDSAPAGLRSHWDGEHGGDNFDGQGIVLTIYHDLPTTPQDLSYAFTDDQVAALNAYAGDGRFALGFDPDCHFYNDGVQLDIVTQDTQIPEPATLGLLLLGSLALIARGYRRA